MDVFFEIIGYIGGFFTAVCFLPQTLKTLKNKAVNDLSLFSYGIYSIGILCWILYGFYVHSVQMVVFNSISLVFALAIFYMIVKYKNKNKRG